MARRLQKFALLDFGILRAREPRAQLLETLKGVRKAFAKVKTKVQFTELKSTRSRRTIALPAAGWIRRAWQLHVEVGGAEFRKRIKGEFKVASDGTEPFIHVFKNLYAVPTPFGPNSGPTEIEDLFDPATKATKLNGKSFCSEKKIDDDTQYSKSAFAEEVIAANAGKIDFSGFKPLLTNIVAAISAHHKAVIKPTPKP